MVRPRDSQIMMPAMNLIKKIQKKEMARPVNGEEVRKRKREIADLTDGNSDKKHRPILRKVRKYSLSKLL